MAGERAIYFRTRGEAWAAVLRWASQDGRRKPLLLGVDFALGFPRKTAAACGVNGWRGVWELLDAEVRDNPETNANNRFAVAGRLNERAGAGPGGGPWWGSPPNAASPWLTSRRGFDWPVEAGGVSHARMRTTDQAVAGVQEVWKLLGVGSVGSQTLLGIAGLVRLERALASIGLRLRVWPFERAAAPAAGELWVAECWPGLVADRWRPAVESGTVRDAAQVDAWSAWAREEASALWDLPLPPEAAEEGWIIGANP